MKAIHRKVETKSFSERLQSIKEMFKIAHDNADSLNSEIQKEIENKGQQINSIQSEIDALIVTKEDTEKFIENISKLI